MALSLSQSSNVMHGGAHGAINNGSTAFTDATGQLFTVEDSTFNLLIDVNGAGSGGSRLSTDITGFTNTTLVALAASNASGGNLTTAQYMFGLAHASFDGNKTFTFIVPSAVAAGDCGAFGINTDPSVTISSVTDNSGSNTWTNAVPSGTNGTVVTSNYFMQGWTCMNMAAASAGALVVTVVLSATPADYNTSFSFASFHSSVAGTWSVHKFANAVDNTGTSSAVNSGNVTTTIASCAIWGWTAVNHKNNAVGSGFTSLPVHNQNNGSPTIPNDAYGDIQMYQLVTSTGTFAASSTESAAGNWGCSVYAFAFTPTGSTPTVPLTSYPDRMAQPARTALETSFYNPPPVVAARLKDAAPLSSARPYYPGPWELMYARNTAHAAFMQAAAAMNLLPISAPSAPTRASTSYPDSVAGPARPASDFVTSGYIAQVDDAGVDVNFPDAIPRPVQRDQGYWTTVRAPERTQVYVDQDFPDRVPGPRAVAQQQDAASRPLAPERTSPLAAQSFPDAVPGPQPRQNGSWVPAGAPERSATYIDQDYPDRVRAAAAVAQQQDVGSRPLAPERTAPLAAQSYPDRIDRARSAPDYALSLGAPIPNAAAPIGAYWSYPDQVLRVGGLPTAQQQAASARNLPPLVYTRNWDLTNYPSRVDRAPAVAQFFDATEIPPKPQPNAPAPIEGYSSYPERVPGPQRVAQQQDVGARPLAPETKLPTPYTSYPERAIGAALAPNAQQAVAALPTRPEEPVPVTYGSYPDRVPGSLAVAQQQAVAALPIAPEVKLPLDWRASYPDAVRGPMQPQYFAATEVGLPPAIPTFFADSYPDIVRGRAFPTEQQQAFAGPVAPPPAPVVPLNVYSSYPDLAYRAPPWIAAYWSATTAMLVVGPTPPTVLLLPPTSTSTSVVPTSSSAIGLISSSS